MALHSVTRNIISSRETRLKKLRSSLGRHRHEVLQKGIQREVGMHVKGLTWLGLDMLLSLRAHYQAKEAPIVRKHTKPLRDRLSRREALRGLAGIMLALGLEGCAPSLFSSSAPTPVPTPRSRGSVLYTYRGHTAHVAAVAWSPNGKYIASGSLDQTVQVWAANPGDHFHPFIYRGHTAGVQPV